MSMNETFKKYAPEIMQRLISEFSMSVDDAAAIVGNAGHESGGFVELEQIGGGDGLGLFQWSGVRHHSFVHFCDSKNMNPLEVESSIEFLFAELHGTYGYCIHLTKAATSLFAKVETFEHYYERAGVPALRSRYQWAQRARELHEGVIT